jgi:hypothetical protein
MLACFRGEGGIRTRRAITHGSGYRDCLLWTKNDSRLN